MYDWLTPFSFFTGCALVWGYALLGTTWLLIKSEDDLHAWSKQLVLPILCVVVVCMAVVSLAVPLMDLEAASRWGFAWTDGALHIDFAHLAPLLPIPLLVLVIAWQLRRNVRLHPHSSRPFWCAVGLFALGYVGLAVGLFPYLIPYAMTIHEGAAARNSQELLLVGALIMLPIILAYTAFVYWVFRGKVADAGYH